jgi:hypothetical protein
MAANREVVQRRTFAKGFTRNFSVFLAFYKSRTLKRKPKFSTVRSTVGQDFVCKTVQFCVTRRESETTETPSVSDALQRSENRHKKPFLNYKSAALPAELCRQKRGAL